MTAPTFSVARVRGASGNQLDVKMPLPPGTSVDRFFKAPVVLADHDVTAPVARVSELATADGFLTFHAVLDATVPRAKQMARHVAGDLVRWAEALIDETGTLVEVSLTATPRGELPDDDVRSDAARNPATPREMVARFDSATEEKTMSTNNVFDGISLNEMATVLRMDASFDRVDLAAQSPAQIEALFARHCDANPAEKAKFAKLVRDRTAWRRPLGMQTEPTTRLDALESDIRPGEDAESASRRRMQQRNATLWQQPIGIRRSG